MRGGVHAGLAVNLLQAVTVPESAGTPPTSIHHNYVINNNNSPLK